MKDETKNCQNCKQDFKIEEEDFNFYEKMKVPPPTFCPECRMIRRFHYRNESNLFRRLDSSSGKEAFSGFSSEARVVTYENNYWYGNSWNPLEYGINYDFSKTFFDQFSKLLSIAPIPTRSVLNLVNSDYCNEASFLKNSYLCFNSDYVENSAYIRKTVYIKDSFDLYDCAESELCYESVTINKSFQTFFSFDCENCVDVWFSKGLRGCTNCFGCVNLINKSNYFFNKPYSKEEYHEKIKNFLNGSFESLKEIQDLSRKFWSNFPNKYYHGSRNVNSTGERIFNSKNVKDSYAIRGGENLKFCQDIPEKASNSYDFTVWSGENLYECVTCGMGAYGLKFCFNCWDNVRDMEYCVYCLGSSNCFGCVGLYKKEYCIFNKQYSKTEYFEMVEKIKKHMDEIPYKDKMGRVYKYGEFFPIELSPVAYNESMANDFFHINEQQAKEKGYIWREQNLRTYETTIDAKNLPDKIQDTEDGILNEIIKCFSCERAYRIINSELQFYKKFQLPLPRLCFNCRFSERFKFINPPKLWHRSCMCTKKHNNHESRCREEFETSYAPDRPEIVYCEKCYQQEVY